MPTTAHATGRDVVGRQRAGFVINPIKFDDVDDVRRQMERICAENGWDEPLWLETTEEDPGAGQAREVLDAGCDLVVPIGGDGTVRTVASQLVGTDVPLGLVPGGTGNLLARNLDLPVTSREGALNLALTGADRRVDVGQVRYWDTDGETHEEYFLVMGGVGMDADVMESTDDEVKKRFGWMAYARSAVLLGYDTPVPASIRTGEDEPVRKKIRSVLFGNVGKLQGGVAVLPEARIDDGQLDTLVVAPRGITGWAGVVAGMVTRGSVGGGNVSYHQGTQVDVQLATPTRAQVDGDGVGYVTRIAGRIVPEALTVRVRAHPIGGEPVSGAGAAGARPARGRSWSPRPARRRRPAPPRP